MRMPETITMTMRELDRLKVTQAVVDHGLMVWRAAEKLGTADYLPGLQRAGHQPVCQHLSPSVTLWQAASPEQSQLFALIGALFILPFILVYTTWSYYVFGRRSDSERIKQRPLEIVAVARIAARLKLAGDAPSYLTRPGPLNRDERKPIGLHDSRGGSRALAQRHPSHPAPGPDNARVPMLQPNFQ